MAHILVLTAAPGSKALRELPLGAIEAAVSGHAIEPFRPRWLAADEAWETAFTLQDPQQETGPVAADIRALIGALPVDANIIGDDKAERRKKLLIADMDSTVIEQECIDEIADFAGIKPRISQITERAMRGELAFDEALRERVGLLKGLGEDKLRRVIDERLTLMSGARTLVRTMRAHGAFCALVSGGFSYFSARIAEKVGFNADQANRLNFSNGRLDGSVDEPILGREAKLDALRRFGRERGLDMPQCLAVGDGANDLGMINAAGLGVAYRAKPVVAAEADAAINHGDLTALLYLQGYRRDEFELA